MATTTDWLPARKPDQLVMFQNVRAKSDVYQTALGLTPDQIAKLNLICDIFINAYTFAAQAKSAMEGVTNWRDNIFNGSPAGTAAPVLERGAVVGRKRLALAASLLGQSQLLAALFFLLS